MSLDHHAQARRLRSGRRPYRSPRDDAGMLDDDVLHVVAPETGDETLRIRTLPGLQ